MKITGLLFTLAFSVVIGAAHGQSIDYDPRRATDLRPCDDLRHRGRIDEARQCYGELTRVSPNLLYHAEAAWALNDQKRANALFRELMDNRRAGVHARVRWGYLFIETHQYSDAMAVFQQALKTFPNDLQAKLGIARVYAETFDGQARTLVEQILAEDDTLLGAHLLLAKMSIEEGKLDEAEKSLDRATRLAEQQNMPPLDIYSLRASMERVRGEEGRNKWVTRALDYNPRYGGIYATLAHAEVMRRRYAQAVDLLRQAVATQPDLWSAHAELGANLLRLGQMEEGQKHLATAYSGDPYSTTTVNTLRLLDRLPEFEVFRTQVSTADPNVNFELHVRLHKSEADALRPYVVDLARSSLQTFSQRYAFQPKSPVVLELYPDHDDFAVRAAGLPGIGLLGVTFGYVVAMDSPSGRPPGEFHWGSTLWHELAHVFTLEATDHHVPRWLSEGISMFEEWRTGPTPGVTVPPGTLVALRDGKFLGIDDLDSGFIRPSYPDQVQVSYVQAGLICYFIEQQYGFEKLAALLRQYDGKRTTPAAIQAVFKMPSREFDEQFNAFVRKRYDAALGRLDEWREAHGRAVDALAQENWTEAATQAQRAISIYNEDTSPGSAYLIAAKALDKLNRRQEALATLVAYRTAGGWHPEALRQLGEWYEQADDKASARDVWTALNYVDPLSQGHHGKLAENYLSSQRFDAAEREYRVMLALNPHDVAPSHLGIARALQAQGDQRASRRHVLQALEAAPMYKPAQELLLQMHEERSTP